MSDLQRRAVQWHKARFPEAACEHVLLKAIEELGEASSAWNDVAGANSTHSHTIHDFVKESADLVIVMMVAVGRYANGDLLGAVYDKMRVLETPGAHKASISATHLDTENALQILARYPMRKADTTNHPGV